MIVLDVPPAYCVPVALPSAHLQVEPVFVIDGKLKLLDVDAVLKLPVRVPSPAPNVYVPLL